MYIPNIKVEVPFTRLSTRSTLCDGFPFFSVLGVVFFLSGFPPLPLSRFFRLIGTQRRYYRCPRGNAEAEGDDGAGDCVVRGGCTVVEGANRVIRPDGRRPVRASESGRKQNLTPQHRHYRDPRISKPH